MEMNSGPRWLISMTDMPLPCQSSISLAACCSTSFGRTAGPAEKLNTCVVMRSFLCAYGFCTSWAMSCISFATRGIITRWAAAMPSVASFGVSVIILRPTGLW